MDAASSLVTAAAGAVPPPGRRADAGTVRLGGRDVAGLLLAGDMYGAPYDLLAGFLGVQPARLRGIVARWRHAGYAATGRLGPGPAWCWLTRPGLAVTGQRYAPTRPALGYLAQRVPHPVPIKAAQGKSKTRLILDPERAPAVAAIFEWRTRDRLGCYAITQRLAADPGRYPPPAKAGRWTEASVYAILANPKYTGYMVFGRQRTTPAGRSVPVPPDQWLWSPDPAHPAIITRATWDAAQGIGAEHSTSRDDPGPNTHRQTRRTYVLRSRIRCRSCQRRMSGITRTSARYWAEGPDYSSTYYTCLHDPANPRHTAKEGHPRTISVREDDLLDVIAQFFTERVFGPDRAALLAKDLPASAADDQARRDRQAAALTKRLRQIDAAENAHAREIEALADLDPRAPAVTALRSRVLARFTELEDERATISTQLAGLTKTAPQAGDPALLDALPHAGAALAGAAPRIQQQLYQAFDLQALYNKNLHQVTIHITITDSTPQAVAAIIAAASGSPAAASTPDPEHPYFSDLAQTPIRDQSTMIMKCQFRRPEPGLWPRSADRYRHGSPAKCGGQGCSPGHAAGSWGSAVLLPFVAAAGRPCWWGGASVHFVGVTVVGLGAWSELACRDQRGMDVNVQEFAVLDDGRRVSLHEDRGFTTSATHMSAEHAERSVLTTVLPDDAEVTGEEHPWEWLASLICDQGVAVTPEQLKAVPYVLEFGPRLSALLRSEDRQER